MKDYKARAILIYLKEKGIDVYKKRIEEYIIDDSRIIDNLNASINIGYNLKKIVLLPWKEGIKVAAEFHGEYGNYIVWQ